MCFRPLCAKGKVESTTCSMQGEPRKRPAHEVQSSQSMGPAFQWHSSLTAPAGSGRPPTRPTERRTEGGVPQQTSLWRIPVVVLKGKPIMKRTSILAHHSGIRHHPHRSDFCAPQDHHTRGLTHSTCQMSACLPVVRGILWHLAKGDGIDIHKFRRSRQPSAASCFLVRRSSRSIEALGQVSKQLGTSILRAY